MNGNFSLIVAWSLTIGQGHRQYLFPALKVQVSICHLVWILIGETQKFLEGTPSVFIGLRSVRCLALLLTH